MLIFLVNWAACGKPSLRNGFHFFLGEGGGDFWKVVVGVHCPPHLILTLFQGNIYKINVREFLPWDKMDKGTSWGQCAHCRSPCPKNTLYSLGQSSSETQGQIVGARESLNGQKNMAQRKVSPFFTFLCAIFFRPFRLSLAPTICPWVFEDVGQLERLYNAISDKNKT